MPRKKTQSEEWVNGETAAALLTKQSGHTVSPDYVRRLGNTGKLTTKPIDGRTKVYLRSDVENYTVRPRGTGEVRRAIRGKKLAETR
jgi:hypothetical protein